MSLRSFMDYLDRRGLIKNVEELSPEYEAPYVISQETGRGGPAIRFKLRNFPGFMGVGNILDTRDKLHIAMGTSNDVELYRKLIDAENNPSKPTITNNAAFKPLKEVNLRRFPYPSSSRGSPPIA